MLSIMRKFFYRSFLLCFFSLFIVIGSQAQQRGKLVSSQLVAVKSTAEINQLLNETLGGGIGSIFVTLFLPTYYDVAAYRIVYETIDPQGNPTLASGSVFRPLGNNCNLAMVNYHHGTLTADRDVPSGFTGIESVIGFALATDSYVAVMPDYLGLGESPLVTMDYHPYLHAKSEATASVDMMRAAKELCNVLNVGLNGQTFLTGYSQGAHATLATQREIESYHTDEFDLTYVTAGSGPYDLYSKQTSFVFANPTYENPSFLPYLMLGYQNVYGGIYNNLDEVFNEPFTQTVPSYFDGSRNVEQIDSLLPQQWKTMFTPAFLNDVQNNSGGRFRLLLRDNTVLGWRPRTQLRMYFCFGDELVDFQNSLTAWGDFFKRGAFLNVAAIPVGFTTHFECAQYSLLVTKIKFDSKNKGCTNSFWDWFKHKSAIDPQLVDLYLQNKEEVDEILALVEETNTPSLEEMLAEHNPKGLEELNAYMNQGEMIKTYPNPSVEEVTLDLTSLETAVKVIQVFDSRGKLIQVTKKDIADDFIMLDFKDKEKGYYIIKVTSEAGTYQTKVMVY